MRKRSIKFISSLAILTIMMSVCFSIFANAESTTAEDLLQSKSTNSGLSEINYSINKNLTSAQITERFNEINSNYEINEPFSAADAEFIKLYAKLATADSISTTNAIKLSAVKTDDNGYNYESFSKSKTSSGVTVKFTGTVYSNINIVNHWYRGNMTAKITEGSSKVQSIKLVVTNVAYGLLGNQGTYIGIVYDGSGSSSTTTNKTSFSMDKTIEYGAIGVVYTHTNAYTEIKTTSGTFNLYAF